MNKMKIGLLPYNLKANSYIKINREILGRLGAVVEAPRPKDLLIRSLGQFLSKGSFILYDVLILNFRESVIKSKNNSISLIGSIEFYFMFITHRLVSRKLVFVRHDTHPHNMNKIWKKLSIKMIDIGQSIANKVVSLSPVYAKSNGYFYVPHPLYNIASFVKEDVEINEKFVVFGRIERYKNIDKIIKSIDISVELLVIGPCVDFEYLKELKKLARDKKVMFEVGFQADEVLQKSISSSNGVIITNEASSMLVSGSFFYAISCGARVYTLDAPFMKWVKSTSLGAYVTVEPNVELLMERVANNRINKNANECGEILIHAELLFGDSVVEEAWRKVLDI